MTAAIELPTAGAYRLDPERSTVSFRTRHIFGLAPVRGTFRLRDGRIPVADPVTAATATIDAHTFHTGLSMRDQTVRSGQYLDAEHAWMPGRWLTIQLDIVATRQDSMA